MGRELRRHRKQRGNGRNMKCGWCHSGKREKKPRRNAGRRESKKRLKPIRNGELNRGKERKRKERRRKRLKRRQQSNRNKVDVSLCAFAIIELFLKNHKNSKK